MRKILFSDFYLTNTIFLNLQRRKNFTDRHYTIFSNAPEYHELSQLPQ
jgi:hypothetical protein